MYWPFVIAGPMPLVVVNISSIFTGRVIQSLSTLELTVRRHFCSNLKHSPLPVLRRGEASNSIARSAPVTCASGTSSSAGEQSGKYHDYHKNCLSIAGARNPPVFQDRQLRLDVLRFVLVRRRTMKYKTAKTATKRTIQCELAFTNVTQPSTLEIKSGCTW